MEMWNGGRKRGEIMENDEEAERFCEENGEGDERKVRENEMKREKDMSQMKLVRLNEVGV